MRLALAAALWSVLPVAALAQPPPLPDPAAPLEAPAPGLARIRLKSNVPGIHLVEAPSGRRICFADCAGELSVMPGARYQLHNEQGSAVSDEFYLPSTLTQATIEYRGRNQGLFIPGLISTVVGAVGAAGGLLLALGGFAFSVLMGGWSSVAPFVIGGLIAAGVGVVFLVPGLILTVLGARSKAELVRDDGVVQVL